jgi:hypothetical protein
MSTIHILRNPIFKKVVIIWPHYLPSKLTVGKCLVVRSMFRRNSTKACMLLIFHSKNEIKLYKRYKTSLIDTSMSYFQFTTDYQQYKILKFPTMKTKGRKVGTSVSMWSFALGYQFWVGVLNKSWFISLWQQKAV